MRKVKLSFANLQVDFVDRELAMEKVRKWAEEGMVKVQVVYGPEGCGKTAWLKQSAMLLRELGFDVIYVNPVDRESLVEADVEGVRRRLLEILREATNEAWVRAVWALIDLARELIKAGKRRVAVLVDDAFQAIGLDKAAIYVKGLLGLIEYPPEQYDTVVAVVATSEGISRREIGRHRWAGLKPMWNMSREGFRQLYDQLPGGKPSFEEAWRLTGGNPKMLAELYKVNWRVDEVLNDVASSRMLRVFVNTLTSVEKRWLWEAIEDPDTLFVRERMNLLSRLVELNLVIDDVPIRDSNIWIDEPPLEGDKVLGVGRYVAWQSPLHREVIKDVLKGVDA